MSWRGSDTLSSFNTIRYKGDNWPRGYKTFFMLNSAEQDIVSLKYENANNGWHFYIY